MSEVLFPLALTIYAFAPVVIMVLIGIQFRIYGKGWIAGTLFGLALIWGIRVLTGPYIVVWLPDVFPANFQQSYLCVRGGVVLLYAILAIISLFRKSRVLQLASFAVVALLMTDLVWAFWGGRYVGP